MANILLVEDDTLTRELIKLRLELADYDVIIAKNGKIGFEKALAHDPSLVLMDMHMPVMGGYESVRALRKENYKGQIVALTASALTADTQEALISGCNGVIIKPIMEDFEKLVAGYILDSI